MFNIELYMIQEDINFASLGIYYPKDENMSKEKSLTLKHIYMNPAALNYSAYHAGQAIEKSLKYIIERENASDWVVVSNSHDISLLLQSVCQSRPEFALHHPEISFNAKQLSCLNSYRYVKSNITKEDTYYLVKVAKNLYKELEIEFEKTNPDANVQQIGMRHVYNKPIFPLTSDYKTYRSDGSVSYDATQYAKVFKETNAPPREDAYSNNIKKDKKK